MSKISQEQTQAIQAYKSQINTRLIAFQQDLAVLSEEAKQLEKNVFKSLDNAASANYMSRTRMAEVELRVALEYGKGIRKHFVSLDLELQNLMKDLKENINTFIQPENEEE